MGILSTLFDFSFTEFQIYENTGIIAEHGTAKPAQASPLPASAPSTTGRQRASVPYGPLMKPLSDEDEWRPFPT